MNAPLTKQQGERVLDFDEATTHGHRALAVYDGMARLGTIVVRDGQFMAFDAHERPLGSFDKQAAALRAFGGTAP